MADLAITMCRTVQINGENDLVTGPAAEAITRGNYVRRDTVTGQITKGNATSAGESRDGGLALATVGAGETVTFQRGGIADLGNALAALAFDADVFLSDTDGALSTTAGTTSKVVGTVVPAFGSSSGPDRLLQLKDL